MLTVKTEGLNRVKNRFSKIEHRSKDPKKAMDLIGAKAWKEIVKDNFANEKNKDGKKSDSFIFNRIYTLDNSVDVDNILLRFKNGNKFVKNKNDRFNFPVNKIISSSGIFRES